MQRHIPETYVPHFADATIGAEVYRDPAPGRLVLIGFSGRREKPDFHLRFHTEARMSGHLEQWKTKLLAKKEHRAAERAAQHSQRSLAVGDVLRSSWGYEQTNVDFYEVIALVGTMSVKVRPIKDERREDVQLMTGVCWPLPGQYAGGEFTARVTRGNAIKVRGFGVYATKLECTEKNGVKVYPPSRWTSYA